MSDIDGQHKVKSNIWRDGKLTVFEHFFDTFVDALNFSRQSGAQTSKIYGPNGDLMHSASSNAPAVEQTYA
jgi:hypothetical protein